MKRLASVIVIAASTVPLPAVADCASRISAVEKHPAVNSEAPDSSDQSVAKSSSQQLLGKQPDEETVVERVVDQGAAVQEGGGTTVYQQGGPATPRENWFGSPPQRAAILSHLDAARKALAGGQEADCMVSIEKAEAMLSPDGG